MYYSLWELELSFITSSCSFILQMRKMGELVTCPRSPPSFEIHFPLYDSDLQVKFAQWNATLLLWVLKDSRYWKISLSFLCYKEYCGQYPGLTDKDLCIYNQPVFKIFVNSGLEFELYFPHRNNIRNHGLVPRQLIELYLN